MRVRQTRTNTKKGIIINFQKIFFVTKQLYLSERRRKNLLILNQFKT